MAIGMETEVRGERLGVRCRGEYSLDAALDAYRRVFEAAASTGLRQVLVDVRDVEGEPTTMDRFALAEFVVAHGRGLRVAILGREPLIDPERFGETVVQNRGAGGRAFTVLEEALAWLARGTPPGPA